MTATQQRPSRLQPDIAPVLAEATQGRLADGTHVCTCGRRPSDHPALAGWLEQEIESMSLYPDAVGDTSLRLAAQP